MKNKEIEKSKPAAIAYAAAVIMFSIGSSYEILSKKNLVR